MSFVARFVSGRWTKFVVVAAWVLVLVPLFAPLGSKLSDATDDRTESFLPPSAQSTKVVRLQNQQFAGGQTANGLIVYRRPGGFSADDRRSIAADASRAADTIPVVGKPVVPFQRGSPANTVSRDGSTAFTTLTVPANNDKLADWGKDVRDAIGKGSGGMRIYVTGDIGFNADFDEVFGSLDTKLLFATVVLVLFLLLAIYRSPVIAVIPLVVVGIAYAVAQGLVYLYAESGATVSSNATTILVVLMFGVGTDYCLLLVSRYREELRHVEDKHAAMERAMERVGPALIASGVTVVLAMLVLLVAENGSIHSLGPSCAIGIACALVAGITLLPALLTIVGRRGFWPRKKLVAYGTADAEVARRGIWGRIGERVLARPGAALGFTVLLFGAGALGLLAYKEDYSTRGFFKKATDSVDGFDVLARAFPSGTLAPTTVLVQREDGPVRPADVQRAVARLRGQPQVASVTPSPQLSRNRRIAQVSVVFRDDPYQAAALERVPGLRDRLKDMGPGVTALVGAGSAINYDYNTSSARDFKLIVPLALLVIAIILGVLLQAVVAPLVLIATVMASFFGTLGLAILFFRYVDGQGGIDASLPTFAFIFLVALGTDYTIFLMSRVREEARRHGTREGTLRALAATGPVITSAGLILAGTFSVLMTLPVTFAFNIGFIVAVG
ncbi:MAG TPA: MMPL family transporter, partial [Gemmatimonadaceae bacterium]|nr:MMPL family transporter [Gemmatimonadaceae bacterium]